jgi:hypothetical protein
LDLEFKVQSLGVGIEGVGCAAAARPGVRQIPSPRVDCPTFSPLPEPYPVLSMKSPTICLNAAWAIRCACGAS